MFAKAADAGVEPLESRIKRLFYINAYGHEIQPFPNPDFITSLSTRDVLLYSCGSLWTSIIPCLALRGLTSAIARSRTLRAKILLLNAQNDRETDGYSAVDYVNAITRTLDLQEVAQSPNQAFPVSAFITHLVHLKGTVVAVDRHKLKDMGIRCIEVESRKRGHTEADGKAAPLFDADCVHRALRMILDEQNSR